MNKNSVLSLLFQPLFLPLFLPLLLSLNAGQAADGNSTTIVIDGSSTVYPITVAIGERYAAQNTSATIEILCSGSTAGFRRLIAGEVPISGASRPIKADELAKAAKVGIEIIELPVAIDGLSVVVNKRNTFVDSLTVAELRKIWQPDSTIKSWQQVRPNFPDIPLVLFGPGKDSGTFDYFTEVIVGTARSCRSDYTGSEDDNVLVQGVERNAGGLGYFGLSYLRENEALLKAVAINAGNGAILPTSETIINGTYRPLSRPLFLYVNKAAIGRAEVRQFLDAYIKMVPSFAPQVGCVSFEPRIYELVAQRLAAQTTGSIFLGAKLGAKEDAHIGELLAAQHQLHEAAAAAAPTQTQKKIPASANKTASATQVTLTVDTPLTPLPPAKLVIPLSSTAEKKAEKNSEKTVDHQTSSPAAATVAAAASTTVTAIEKVSLRTLDAQRLDLLRARAISLARHTLDEFASLDEISARVEELRLLTASMSQPNAPASEALIPTDQAGFTALVERLQLTNEGRSVLSEKAFAQLKTTLISIADGNLRQRIAAALLHPGPDQLPSFTTALSAANGGRADVDAILCFARGGFIVP